jgi:hypothetical protein
MALGFVAERNEEGKPKRVVGSATLVCGTMKVKVDMAIMLKTARHPPIDKMKPRDFVR